MKFYLRRIRLNSQGYTDKGEYFGSGLPLYEYFCEEMGPGCVNYIRVFGRKHAREVIKRRHGLDVKFFR